MIYVCLLMCLYRFRKQASIFPPAFGIPPFKGGFSHLAASPPFFFARPLSTLCSSPEGERLLADFLIFPESLWLVSLIFDLNDRTTPQSASRTAPQAYYKTIIPKNPKKGALTPGSIF